MDHNALTPKHDDDRTAAREEHARVDAQLVDRARGDDPDAFGALYERWFERVHDLAFRITRDDGLAAEVAQDAFVSAWRGLPKLEKPEAFGGWLLRITRNGALNRRRKELRSSPRDSEGMAVIEATTAPQSGAPAGFRVEDRTATSDDPARAAEDTEIASLVWESAEALGERDAEVLDLSLRHGLTPAEIGDVMGMNRNAANQTVHRVRTRLKTAVEARVLWRGGEPVCGDLADALAAADVTRFGSDAVRVATEHASSCAQCAGRRSMKLEPSALFAATPFLVAPLLKAKVAHALAGEGVPMGSASAGPPDTGDVDAPDDPASGSGHRWTKGVLAGAAVVVLALAAVAAVAEEIDEASPRTAVEPRVATTTTPVPEILAPTTGVSTPASTPTTRPRVLPPAPPPAPPVAGTIAINPSSAPGSTFLTPTLSWSTQNATTVEVTGPGFASTAPNGASPACPGNPTGSACVAGPGTYVYTLRARDGFGIVVLERSVSFVVT